MSGNSGRAMSLMLVDDNPTFLRILQRFLEERGGEEVRVVETAGGGREALAKAKNSAAEIIVVDLAMPDMHGLELIPHLRRMLPNVGIIALTMLGGESYQRAATAAGADDFVGKSELEVELLPAIRRVAQARGITGDFHGHGSESHDAPDADLDRRGRMPEAQMIAHFGRWTTCVG